LNTTFAAGASFAHGTSQQMQNGELFTVQNNTSVYNAGITPTIFDWLELKFAGKYTRNTSASDVAGYAKQFNGQWNENTSIIFYPAKNMSIDFDNQYLQSFQGKQNLSSALLMNSYIQYNFQNPKLHKLQLRLSCDNIANVRNYQVVNISNNIVSRYGYLLQPRMLLLSAHFDW